MSALERLKREELVSRPSRGWSADGDVTVKYADLALALAALEAAILYGSNQYSGLDDALEALTKD